MHIHGVLLKIKPEDRRRKRRRKLTRQQNKNKNSNNKVGYPMILLEMTNDHHYHTTTTNISNNTIQFWIGLPTREMERERVRESEETKLKTLQVIQAIVQRTTWTTLTHKASFSDET